MAIDSTAIVAEGAQIAEDAEIRSYCVIGGNVTVGSRTVIGPHVVVDGWTDIGSENQISPFCSIGLPPQDTSYKGEQTRLQIGDRNTFREGFTVHRGTARGAGVTRIGNDNFFMAYSHVAHDCQVGHNVTMANGAVLGGHVQLGDRVNIGGLCAVHQFVRVGAYAFLGGMSGLRMDMPPYMIGFGTPATLFGPNVIGLRRAGIANSAIRALKQSYRLIFRSGLILEEALEKVHAEVEPCAEVDHLVSFLLESSKRGFTRQSND